MGKSERAVRMLLAMEPHVKNLNPLLTFGGDLLAPSLMSSVTKGKHMVEALDLLGAHVATLGNHDFDFGIDRARELTQEPCLFDFDGAACPSTVKWIVSNITGIDGAPVAGALPWWIQEWNGVNVGFIAVSENWLADAGLTPESESRDKHAKWEDEVISARSWASHVREQGAELVFCLCHDLISNTEQLAASVPEVDFFLGGHEHLYQEGENWVIAGYDFDDFCILKFEVPAKGSIARPPPPKKQRIQVPGDSPSEAELRATTLTGKAAKMRELVQRYSSEVEAVLVKPLGCKLSRTLDTRKFLMRTQETMAGNLFAGAVYASLKGKGAECCFLISGMISGFGKTLPGPLTLGNIIQWFPWEGGTCIIEVAGATLLEALEHGCHKLPRRFGMFPQVSGISFEVTVDPEATAGSPGSPYCRVSDVRVDGQPLDTSRVYKVATGEYVADGGDGYTMFMETRRLVSPEGAPLLQDAIQAYLTKDEDVQVPSVEGRIRHKRSFVMHVEPSEVGATPLDPTEEELLVPAWKSLGE